MASSGESKFSNKLSERELEAQQLACTYLLKGCERALFQFGLVAGENATAESAGIDERAADIMRDILGSWRETLSLLQAASPAGTPAGGTGWTLMSTPRSANHVGERHFD